MKIRQALWPVVFAFMVFFIGQTPLLLADNIEATLSSGREAIKSGRPDETVDLFSRSIASDPHTVLYHYRGLAYSAQDREDLAIKGFTRAISLKLHQASYYMRRGLSLFRTGQYQQAVKDFTKVMELQPKNPYARSKLAQALFLSWSDAKSPG